MSFEIGVNGQWLDGIPKKRASTVDFSMAEPELLVGCFLGMANMVLYNLLLLISSCKSLLLQTTEGCSMQASLLREILLDVWSLRGARPWHRAVVTM